MDKINRIKDSNEEPLCLGASCIFCENAATATVEQWSSPQYWQSEGRRNLGGEELIVSKSPSRKTTLIERPFAIVIDSCIYRMVLK